MNSRKVNEIIKFSFYKNLQNKWFILFNILTLVGMVVILNFGNISALFKSSKDDMWKVEVIDEYNLVYDSFNESLSGDDNYSIARIEKNEYTAENIPDNLMVLEILPNETQSFEVSIISKEGIIGSKYTPITDELVKIRNDNLRKLYEITEDELNVLQSDLKVNRVLLAVNADDSDTKEIIELFSSAVTYFLTVLIFTKIANEISSEKQSKSTEYILTTVSAKEYLFAKIFSNIAVLIIQGLFLLAYYLIAALLSNIINASIMSADINSASVFNMISSDVVIYIFMLICYSVLNIVLFTIIQATISSKTTSTAEAGNTVSALASIMMILYFVTNIIITPYSKVNTFVYILSILPGISAYFVPAMMVVGQSNMVQIIISLTILVVSIKVVFDKSADIFKKGILDYTKIKKNSKAQKTLEEIQTTFFIKRKMKNVGFVIGMSLIIYVGLQMIFSLIGGLVFNTFLSNIFTNVDITLILQMFLQILSLGIASIFVRMYCEKKSEETAKTNIVLKDKFKIIYTTLLVILALQLLLGLLFSAVGLTYDVTDTLNITPDANIITKLLTVIAIAFVPAIFEELFFRKSLIDFLSKYGNKFALIFSAVLFGIAHMNLSQGIFAFIIGLIFGAIYIYTNDIRLTMTIHFVNNLLGALEMILSESYVLVLGVVIVIAFIYIVVLFISTIINKEKREKAKSLLNINVSIKNFKKKYIYILTEYTFDVAMLLVAVMSIVTENMLSSL